MEQPLYHLKWSAPSNIALVKYWGKKEGFQIPANPSVSFTLNNSRTIMGLKVFKKGVLNQSDFPRFKIFFHGEEKESFKAKISTFLLRLYKAEGMTFLDEYDFVFESENSFPHSAGIASSASSFAAMALCFVELDCLHKEKEFSFEQNIEKASDLARQGSGSACRSLFEIAASWGDSDKGDQFTDVYATSISCHEIYSSFKDAIILVSEKEKSVSSRAGHALMNNNPYAKARFTQAKQNWELAINYLNSGEWDKLGPIVEEEALSLHAMMMASRPGYLLLEPHTISIIKELHSFRKQSNCPAYFTLDAGPNVHLLYPSEVSEQVKNWIESLQEKFPEAFSVIYDEVGTGPRREEV